MKNLLRDMRWILPVSLTMGLSLSLLGPGSWWIGWISYTLLCLLGFSALAALWRSAGSSTALGLMLALAVVLRLGLGMAFSYILPVYGNDTPVQNSGYIFSDSYQRDTQAWDLATSHDSLLKAFDKSTSVDQYGGLLLTSSLLYRLGSPDAHRPWLIILTAALVGAMGAALAYKAASKAWGLAIGLAAGWIMALYPESILLGSSQMREPFLITFVTMGLWGAASWSENKKSAAAWILGGILGMLFFSPGVAVAAIIILAAWSWLSQKERRIRWWVWAGAGALVLAAGALFILALRTKYPFQGGPLASLLNWFRLSSIWDASQLTLNSGWLQNIFNILPEPLHMPFLTGYGILQPVLPAAIADPAVWPMRALGILRGLGWYALMPLLVYSLLPLLKTPDKRQRLAWLWLWAASWAWIVISSLRAGGDQWDNPRYRAILLVFQAALAAQALWRQRETADRWLGRILAVEGVFLLFFGYWYFIRYTGWTAGQVNIFVIIGSIVVLSAVILLAGWIRDRRKRKDA
jgi:hypothetical protein